MSHKNAKKYTSLYKKRSRIRIDVYAIQCINPVIRFHTTGVLVEDIHRLQKRSLTRNFLFLENEKQFFMSTDYLKIYKVICHRKKEVSSSVAWKKGRSKNYSKKKNYTYTLTLHMLHP